MTCRQFAMVMTTAGSGTGGTDSGGGGNVPATPAPGLSGMARCLAYDKKTCRGSSDAEDAECMWDTSADGGNGLCLWVPADPPVQESCLEDGGGLLNIKGKGDVTNWKRQEARNATPCACLLECQTKYARKGPYMAFTLE